MEVLREKDTLLYFRSEDDTKSVIGVSLKAKAKFSKPDPVVWFQERDDLITTAKFTSIPSNLSYKDEDTWAIRFRELDSPCMCSGTKAQYLSIITFNNDPSHKATYKLHLFKLNPTVDKGFYYSYFA